MEVSLYCRSIWWRNFCFNLFIFLVILGIPVITIEFTLGRASQKSPARLYHTLAPNDKKWRIHGYAAVIENYILMMFYTIVAGWMLKYFVDMVSGKMVGLDTSGVEAHFDSVLSDPKILVFYMGITVVVGFIICSFSLQKGLERVTKYMMLPFYALWLCSQLTVFLLKVGKRA